MTVEGVLERIYVFRVVDLVEQMGVVRWLCGPDSPFMRDHPDVKLIVLDSMAFHFRHGQDDLGEPVWLLLPSPSPKLMVLL